jgi:hypothetical protein
MGRDEAEKILFKLTYKELKAIAERYKIAVQHRNKQALIRRILYNLYDFKAGHELLRNFGNPPDPGLGKAEPRLERGMNAHTPQPVAGAPAGESKGGPAPEGAQRRYVGKIGEVDLLAVEDLTCGEVLRVELKAYVEGEERKRIYREVYVAESGGTEVAAYSEDELARKIAEALMPFIKRAVKEAIELIYAPYYPPESDYPYEGERW